MEGEIPLGSPILVIKPEWLSLIMCGKKTIEIRASACRKEPGTRIYLSPSKTATVVGVATFIRSIGPMDEIEWCDLRTEHLSEAQRPYPKTHGWCFSNVELFTHPIPYLVKRGSIVWRKYAPE